MKAGRKKRKVDFKFGSMVHSVIRASSIYCALKRSSLKYFIFWVVRYLWVSNDSTLFLNESERAPWSYWRSIWNHSEGVSSTMFFTFNVKNIYFQIWICPIGIAKPFSHPMSKIVQPKQIYGLVTDRPFG